MGVVSLVCMWVCRVLSMNWVFVVGVALGVFFCGCLFVGVFFVGVFFCGKVFVCLCVGVMCVAMWVYVGDLL